MHLVANSYPAEFRDEVVRLASTREPGVSIERIAADFGVHPMTLHRWLKQARTEDGAKPAPVRSEATALREARKRIRLLEEEVAVLRRAAAYLSQANLPGADSANS